MVAAPRRVRRWKGDRPSESLTELRQSLAGPVVGPGDADYDASRRCFNALVDRVRADRAVHRRRRRCGRPRFRAPARAGGGRRGWPQPGGAPSATAAPRDRPLADAHGRSGRRGADCPRGRRRHSSTSTWRLRPLVSSLRESRRLDRRGRAHLGGGIGHLTSQHGLTCDNLVGAEVVPSSNGSPCEFRRGLRSPLGAPAAAAGWCRDAIGVQPAPTRRRNRRAAQVQRERCRRGAPPLPRRRCALSA